MTRRHEQVVHSRKLGEIRNIMNSMKTLAIMETHKLERLLATQLNMSETIEKMAADFLCFHPQVLPRVEPLLTTILLIGSERGFCGNFNDRLARETGLMLAQIIHNETRLIAVGSKLHPLLNTLKKNIDFVKGANVADDIYRVAGALSGRLADYPQPTALYVLHHKNQKNDLALIKLLPPFKQPTDAIIKYSNPPLLNLSDRGFFLELTEHYLLHALHQALYVSLLIENQQRIQHLEGATHHLDDKTDQLKRKINALRQEEIIEEIEVILLNATSHAMDFPALS